MKKFFSSFFVFILVLLVSLVAVPWNDFSTWAVSIPILENNEIYIKAGVLALAFIFSLIYLLISNSEYNNYGHVNPNTARAAFIPIYAFTIGILVFGASINYAIYNQTPNSTNLLILGFFALTAVTLIVYGHIFGTNFRKESNGKRIAHFVLLVEMAAIASYLTYWFYTYKMSNALYTSFNFYYFAASAAFGILMYLVHIIFFTRNKAGVSAEEELENEIDAMLDASPKPQRQEKKEKQKGKKQEENINVKPMHDGKKTMIVSNSQTIVSSEQNIDPTNMIYEDVNVDPEFTKTTSQSSSPNSIEYYIEKPKMIKPLEPSFDALVAYVRELPQVVTKLDDEKITFYVDRKPFLVLMNYGNYYRMAFKYDLEKGIRLIIKYPTISKNKSTREELWFKANNYGDLPKEVIYQIVKSSYDSVNL